MTLLVAVKVPTRELNPMKRPIRFIEPGIVIVADSRFSHVSGANRIDDAQKLWPLNSFACAGYAGDVAMAEKALLSSHVALRHSDRGQDPNYVTMAVATYLQYWQITISKQRRVEPTTVLVGFHAPGRRPRLFRLQHYDGYVPRQPSGRIAVGSGASHFNFVFSQEVEHVTYAWAAPARTGYKIEVEHGIPTLLPRHSSDLINIPTISVANLVVSSVDRSFHEDGLSDVGGMTQVITLTDQGMYFPSVRGSDTGAEWYDVTQHELRSSSEMGGGQFEVPLLDKFGKLEMSNKVSIRVRPGSISGRIA
jgi:hypothetical protein